jgi:hypothetical protein
MCDNSSSSELLVRTVFVITARLGAESSDFSKLPELTGNPPSKFGVSMLVAATTAEMYGGAGADTLTLTKQSTVTIVKTVIKIFRNVDDIRS